MFICASAVSVNLFASLTCKKKKPKEDLKQITARSIGSLKIVHSERRSWYRIVTTFMNNKT